VVCTCIRRRWPLDCPANLLPNARLQGQVLKIRGYQLVGTVEEAAAGWKAAPSMVQLAATDGPGCVNQVEMAKGLGGD